MGIKKQQQQGYSVCTQPHTESQGGNPPLDPPGKAKSKAKAKAKTKPRCRRRGATRGDHERRDQFFKVRLTVWEFARLEVMARAADITPSEYLREKAGLSKKQGDPEALAATAVLAQARQWLSRLAEGLSAGEPSMDVAMCLSELREIRKFLKSSFNTRGAKSC